MSSSENESAGRFKTRLKLAHNPVHDHFTFDPSKKKSQCKSCPSSLQGKNPSTLSNHLKAKHPSIFKIFVENKNKAQKQTVEEKEQKKNQKAVFRKPDTLNESGSTGVSVKDLIGCPKKTSTKFSHSDPRQKKINRKLAVTIATSSLPVNIVNNSAFKEFVEELNPSARMASKDKMRKEVNQIWTDVRETIDRSLKKCRRVSITTDIWSTKGCTSSYLGVTVHYYNPETKSRGANKIACREFPVRHTAENIADLLLKVLKEFSIDRKLTHMVLDNGSNMVKAVRVFNKDNRGGGQEDDGQDDDQEDENINDEIDSSDEETETDETEEADVVAREVIAEVEEHEARERQIDDALSYEMVRRGACFSHTMQCAIHRVAKTRSLKFGKVMKKTKKYVNKYRKSIRAKDVLGATSFKKKLIGYVKTRWFSDLAMCKSIIEAFEKPDKPLSILTEKLGWDCEITLQDIRTLKLYCEILEPFAKHTDILGGENYSTIQLVYPTLVDLQTHLDEMSMKPGMKKFCDGLTKEVKKYFAHVLDPDSVRYDATYIAATFLDPCWTAILDEEQVDIAKAHLLKLCREYSENNNDPAEANADPDNNPPPPLAFANYKHVSKKISGTAGSAGSLTSLFNSDIETFRKECDRIRLEIQNESKKGSTSTNAEEVMEIVEEIVNFEVDMEINIGASTSAATEEVTSTNVQEDQVEILMKDPLDYWVSEETRYYSPIARVAQDLLTIPATSTPSERLFSASGLLTEGKMSHISPENLEKRVLAKVNIMKPGNQ